MNILITGGAGFIGTHLKKQLVEKGHFVRIFDSLLPQVHGNNPNLDFIDCEFIKGDIRDIQIVKKVIEDIDIIYHLAAETGVGQSQYEIERYVSSNTLGTAILLQSAANAKVKQVIITSSRAVYGEGWHKCLKCDIEFIPEPRKQKDLDVGKWEVFCINCSYKSEAQLMNENHPTMPTSIYGLTKLQQEQLAFQVGKTYDLPITILRLFNVYGPGQSLTNPYVGVLGTFFRQIIAGKDIDIYEDGKMKRDFVYIDDVIKALYLVLGNSETFNQKFNVGTGEVVTLQEAGEEVFRILEVKPKMVYSKKYRLGDIHHAVADISLIKKKINYSPKVLFSEGLRQYLKWASENDSNSSGIDLLAEQQLVEKNLLRQVKNV